jgi:deazaflavin-dependent oxidoreductase (nitroreductase family)
MYMTSTHADPAAGFAGTTAPAAGFAGTTAPSRKSRVLRAMARAGAGASVPLAGRRFFPLWGIVRHTGRRSGRSYALPVVVQRTSDGFIVPLPFGGSTQWARNVLAADGGTLRWRAREYRVVDPEVIDWPQARSSYGPLLRAVIPVTGIRTFLRLTAEGLPPSQASAGDDLC